MKATMILHESSSNIIFFYGDAEFIKHFKQETVEKGGPTETFYLEDLVTHFFGLPPLFVNMRNTHTPYHGFTTEDNMNIQVVQLVGFFLIAFDDKRDLDFLHRKLHVLNSIVTWFIGPTMKYSPGGGSNSRCKLCPEFDPRFPNAQREAWYSVSCMLEVWEYLFFTDQAFMLEAYEKYVVNFNVATKYKDILEVVTQSARIDKLFPSCSIIFVKNKILEFKELRDPTRDILHSSDLLLILLLVNYLHPTRKLLRAIRAVDAANGAFFPDSYFKVRTASTAIHSTVPEEDESSPPPSPTTGININSSSGARRLCKNERPDSQYFEDSDELYPSSPDTFSSSFISPASSSAPRFSDGIGVPMSPLEPLETLLAADGSMDDLRVDPAGRSSSLHSDLTFVEMSKDEDDSKKRTVTLLDASEMELEPVDEDCCDEESSRGSRNREDAASISFPLDSEAEDDPGSAQPSPLLNHFFSEVSSESGSDPRHSSTRTRDLQYLPLSPVLMYNLRKENHATLVNCMSKSGDARIPTNLFFVRIAVKDVVLMFSTTHNYQPLARSISKMIRALDIILSSGIVVAMNPHQLSLQGMQQTHDEICHVFRDGDAMLNEIQHFWKECCKRGLARFLSKINAQFGEKLTETVSDDLERTLESYQNCLKRLYERMFLGSTFGMPNVKPNDFKEFCDQIAQNFLSKVKTEHGSRKDFHNFIQGRVAGFKVILNTFPQTHPGLIHFVHVNRATNQITAPRLLEEKNKVLMSIFCKFVAKCRKVLARSASYAVWKEDDFTFSYSVSFENRQHLDRVGADKAITEEQMENILDGRPVGFLSYNTYHQLKHSLFPAKKPGFDNIVATETFCIHLLELPAGLALRQNRKISEDVWDACYRKGISLA